MSLVVGTRLGPYEIQSAIGAGGMGEVYKARDTRLDRTVAIKVLPPEFSADPERRARFEREAKTVAGLSHPHICSLHDVGEHPSTGSGQAALDLVMEHLAGETLADPTSWYENGQKHTEATFRNGEAVPGTAKFWDEKVNPK